MMNDDFNDELGMMNAECAIKDNSAFSTHNSALNIPAIRFKGFSGEWNTLTLGELGTVATNKRIFIHQTSSTGDVPFYKIGTFGREPKLFISQELFEIYKERFPYPLKGDLLFSVIGSIGRVVEYRGENEYFQDSNIVWLQHNGAIENTFLKQFYSFVKWSGLEGSTIKHLYNRNILETQIDLPCQKEQTQIGNYFQQLDTLIAQHQQKHDNLLNLKKALLEKMFPKQGATVPEIRFKGFSGEWEVKKLNDVSIASTGFPFDSNDFDPDGEYLVVTNGNIQDHLAVVDASIGNRIDIEKSSTLQEYVLNEGEILVTMDGTVGRVAKVSEKMQILAQRVGRLVAKFDHEFLYQLLSRVDFYKTMTVISHGGTIKHISLSEISSYQSFFPKHIDEQRKIGNLFQQLDTLITQHQTQLKKLGNIKQACLEKMFV